MLANLSVNVLIKVCIALAHGLVYCIFHNVDSCVITHIIFSLDCEQSLFLSDSEAEIEREAGGSEARTIARS